MTVDKKCGELRHNFYRVARIFIHSTAIGRQVTFTICTIYTVWGVIARN